MHTIEIKYDIEFDKLTFSDNLKNNNVTTNLNHKTPVPYLLKNFKQLIQTQHKSEIKIIFHNLEHAQAEFNAKIQDIIDEGWMTDIQSEFHNLEQSKIIKKIQNTTNNLNQLLNQFQNMEYNRSNCQVSKQPKFDKTNLLEQRKYNNNLLNCINDLIDKNQQYYKQQLSENSSELSKIQTEFQTWCKKIENDLDNPELIYQEPLEQLSQILEQRLSSFKTSKPFIANLKDIMVLDLFEMYGNLVQATIGMERWIQLFQKKTEFNIDRNFNSLLKTINEKMEKYDHKITEKSNLHIGNIYQPINPAKLYDKQYDLNSPFSSIVTGTIDVLSNHPKYVTKYGEIRNSVIGNMVCQIHDVKQKASDKARKHSKNNLTEIKSEYLEYKAIISDFLKDKITIEQQIKTTLDDIKQIQTEYKIKLIFKTV